MGLILSNDLAHHDIWLLHCCPRSTISQTFSKKIIAFQHMKEEKNYALIRWDDYEFNSFMNDSLHVTQWGSNSLIISLRHRIFMLSGMVQNKADKQKSYHKHSCTDFIHLAHRHKIGDPFCLPNLPYATDYFFFPEFVDLVLLCSPLLNIARSG